MSSAFASYGIIIAPTLNASFPRPDLSKKSGTGVQFCPS